MSVYMMYIYSPNLSLGDFQDVSKVDEDLTLDDLENSNWRSKKFPGQVSPSLMEHKK